MCSSDLLSPGESVITAKATRRYRSLLQAMNDGVEIPGFAGGLIPAAPSGQTSVTGPSNQGSSLVTLRILPSPLFETVVDERASKVSVELIQDYDQGPARATVKNTLDDPYKV